MVAFGIFIDFAMPYPSDARRDQPDFAFPESILVHLNSCLEKYFQMVFVIGIGLRWNFKNSLKIIE